ncbi:unnamed protein product [Closterium sp. Yama58-4]|nr:unnamed protein product [Closterium sp. Yama58-4]
MTGLPENTEMTAIEKTSKRRKGSKKRRRLVDGWMAGLPMKTERTAIETPNGTRRRRRGRRLVEGWVGGPWEKSTSAFQWVNEAGNKEEILGVEAGSKEDPRRYYQWQWPVERLGASWHGMFMRGDAGYDIKNTPSCQGILPESAYVNAPIWGSDAGASELKLLRKLQRQQEKQNHEPIPQDQQENLPQDQRDFMLKERWLIWMPRFGLGNSLRAYTSAFIFALLSGRRLLRWHGGNHKQVLDRLCNAFYCGIDELQYKGDIGRHAKLMDSRKLEMHGFDYSPNVVAVYSGKFFDRLWRGDPQINQCVHSAFACRTIWCIRSKVLSLLLGKGPKPGVQEVVDRDLRVVPPLVPPLVLRGEEVGMKEGEATGGKGPKPGVQKVVDRDLRVVPPLVLPGGGMGTEEGEVDAGTMEPQMVKKGEGLRLQFDLALHIRGHAM